MVRRRTIAPGSLSSNAFSWSKIWCSSDPGKNCFHLYCLHHVVRLLQIWLMFIISDDIEQIRHFGKIIRQYVMILNKSSDILQKSSAKSDGRISNVWWAMVFRGNVVQWNLYNEIVHEKFFRSSDILSGDECLEQIRHLKKKSSDISMISGLLWLFCVWRIWKSIFFWNYNKANLREWLSLIFNDFSSQKCYFSRPTSNSLTFQGRI